ncbi:hypothetical protein GTU99_26025 [Streptomyces sp. PRKS01-65]|nr:hypothetical protein [Streptomyces harenosi]NEY35582.1 hypothetical protein [Streptomyces harenosi]
MKHPKTILTVVTAAGLIALTTRTAARRKAAAAPLPAPAPAVPQERPEGHYDARRGAAGYAPVVGTLGALAVPAVIVVFTNPPKGPGAGQAIAFAAGLLVVAMIGSIVAAIALAAIGAESTLTPNLTPAIMYAAVAVVIALVDIVAAFEILASLALPQARPILLLITAAVGSLGVFFTALALGDSPATRPTHAPDHHTWKKTEWITSQRHANRATLRVTAIGVLPVVTGIVCRLGAIRLPEGTAAANTIILTGLALTVTAIVASALRTGHPGTGPSVGPRPWEAHATTLVASTYAAFLLLLLP